MGLFSNFTKNFAKKALLTKAEGHMPKVISPEVHGAIDYVHVALFLGAGMYFWKRDRRAAVTSFALAGVGFAESLLTAYPMGIRPLISFPVHGKLDRGMVGFAATAPQMLEFQSAQAQQFYRGSALVEGLVVSLTDWDAGHALPASAAASAA